MAIKVAVVKETADGENRVAIDPGLLPKLSKLGIELVMEKGAGVKAHFPDELYQDVTWVDSAKAAFEQAQIILKVQKPTLDEVQAMPSGTILISFLDPYREPELVKALQDQKITSIAMELIPRISRAQSMDALSSQAGINGYKCVLMAAMATPGFFPMLTTAAGTIRPAKVVIIGAGVAGLQAIATAKRLGAQVEAYDIRAAAKEQVESLGAKLIDTGVSADGQGGYARELTDEEKQKQADVLAKHLAAATAVVSTAAIPGRPAPKIITKAMVDNMKPGAVIVDMAAETGGNCELTNAGETVVHNDVTIIGPTNIPSTGAMHASEMYAKNLYNLLSLMVVEQALTPDWEDEVLAGANLTRDGELKHAGVKQALGGE